MSAGSKILELLQGIEERPVDGPSARRVTDDDLSLLADIPDITDDTLTVDQRVYILEDLINRIIIEFHTQGFKLQDEILITQFEKAIKLITK